jgi:lipoate-protein ligase A
MVKVFLSSTFDPYLNLAMEDWLFRDMDPSYRILYLWRNADTVVIGRHQNPWKECRLSEMEKDGVKLARRQTGGGAVFHDSGNLNFTFLNGKHDYSRERNSRIVCSALAKAGIRAEPSGRNDILVEGKKVSGSAFRETDDRAFHHGTLLVDSDLGRLTRYLNPDPKKLASRGVESVKSRVANLSDFRAGLNADRVRELVAEAFFEEYGERSVPERLDHEALTKLPHLREYYELLESWEWRFGKSPQFTHDLSERFPWGGVELGLVVRGGRIESAKAYSDALELAIPEIVERAVAGTEYSAAALSEALLSESKRHPGLSEKLEGIAAWLEKEV